MRKTILCALGPAAVAALFCIVCVDNSTNGSGGGEVDNLLSKFNGGGGTFQVYKKVKIGNQTWMAENLNYATTDSKCYDNDNSYCNKYGRLYNWVEARTACPSGWHLPTDAEWTTLVNYAGGEETAGTKLKSKSGWDGGGNGTDEYGFSALPGGNGYSGGYFSSAGSHGYWWSATEGNASDAWYRFMLYYYEYVGRYYDYKTNLFSVRCVQD